MTIVHVLLITKQLSKEFLQFNGKTILKSLAGSEKKFEILMGFKKKIKRKHR